MSLDISETLDRTIKSWIKQKLPVTEKVKIKEKTVHVGDISKEEKDERPIWFFDYQNEIYLGSNENVREEILDLIDRLGRDMIFSPFGMYEISRITHKFGYYVWGPSWFMFAEQNQWININKHKVEILSQKETEKQLDFKIFWHNYSDCIRSFVVKKNKKILAAATLIKVNDNFAEIGVDTHPDAQLSGLGSTVYSAAGTWAYENNITPYSSVGPWNVPSTRTQLKCGMKYIGADMKGSKEFKVPPQILGSPSKDIRVENYYPKWAFNKEIY